MIVIQKMNITTIKPMKERILFLLILLICIKLNIFGRNFNSFKNTVFEHKEKAHYIDTLFKMDYYYPFSIDESNDLEGIFIVGADNIVFEFKENHLDTILKVENKYFMEHIFVSKYCLLIGNGTFNETENVFAYTMDENHKYKFNFTDRFVISLNDTILLCAGDYTHNKNLSMIDQLVSYQYLLDVQNRDTIFKFQDRNIIVESFGDYYECNINSSLRYGALLKVIRYHLTIKVNEFEVFFPKNVVPVHFGEDYYLSRHNGEICKYNFHGELIESYFIAPKYNSQFQVVNGKLEIYGWLNTDQELNEYYFVRQIFPMEL